MTTTLLCVGLANDLLCRVVVWLVHDHHTTQGSVLHPCHADPGSEIKIHVYISLVFCYTLNICANSIGLLYD